MHRWAQQPWTHLEWTQVSWWVESKNIQHRCGKVKVKVSLCEYKMAFQKVWIRHGTRSSQTDKPTESSFYLRIHVFNLCQYADLLPQSGCPVSPGSPWQQYSLWTSCEKKTKQLIHFDAHEKKKSYDHFPFWFETGLQKNVYENNNKQTSKMHSMAASISD